MAYGWADLARIIAGAAMAVATCHVGAQTHAVQLAGISGSKALLVVDGQAPRFMAVGDTHAGVRDGDPHVRLTGPRGRGGD